jgi:hypothetical protein
LNIAVEFPIVTEEMATPIKSSQHRRTQKSGTEVSGLNVVGQVGRGVAHLQYQTGSKDTLAIASRSSERPVFSMLTINSASRTGAGIYIRAI